MPKVGISNSLFIYIRVIPVTEEARANNTGDGGGLGATAKSK